MHATGRDGSEADAPREGDPRREGAPREWRASDGGSRPGDAGPHQRRRRVVRHLPGLISSILLALLVIASLIYAGIRFGG